MTKGENVQSGWIMQYVIRSQRGAYIRNQSFHPDEYEFLIQKGTSFRILSVQELGDKLHIEMEMIVSD